MFRIPEDAPAGVKGLPIDQATGYPIPFFVARLPDGTRDLRIADSRKKGTCLKQRICWVCGRPLNVLLAVIGGPLGAFNRKQSDMPCHPSCAEFSVKYCPHLNRANAKYRQTGKPVEAESPTGLIMEHPGVIGITYCLDLQVVEVVRKRQLVDLLVQPEQIQRIDWWYEGERVSPDRAAELWIVPQAMQDEAPDMVEAIREFISKTGGHSD